jgi:predicted nuclease with TOPRIM domain
MEDAICTEKHKQIDSRLNKHDKRLDNHGERLDRIEVTSSRLETRLDGLIKELGQLNTTIRWFIGVMVGAFVSFFFYAIQNNIFK